MEGPAMVAKVLRSVGVGFLLAFAVLGVLFLLGETFADPGDVSPWVVAVLVLVPTLLLSALVVWRFAWAEPALTVASVAVALFMLVDAIFDVVPRDVGPVHAATSLVLVAPLALLGWRAPRPAGELLVMVGIAPIVASIAYVTRSGAESGPARGLGGSSSAVALPMIVGGLILLLSSRQQARAGTAERRPRTR